MLGCLIFILLSTRNFLLKPKACKGLAKQFFVAWRALSAGGFHTVTNAGCKHDLIVCSGGRASVEELEFYWASAVFGNLKNALRRACDSIKPKREQRYISEFQYRFNRRYDLTAWRCT
ncbi:MAG: hypothetical protein ACJAUP_001867 [Cellvibrionaceae bacterium]|jgi:hypothetical protein